MKRKTTRREDYLKLTHTLSKGGEVRGSDLADEHQCVHLTQQGPAIAESTLEKHGMLLALLQYLGVPGEVAPENACAIDHSISHETYSVLKQLLNERKVSV